MTAPRPETLIRFTDIVADKVSNILRNGGPGAYELFDALFARLDKELDAPLRISATIPETTGLLIKSNRIKTGDGGTESIPPISDSYTEYPDVVVDLSTGSVSGGGTVVREGAAFSLPTSTIGDYRRMALAYDAENNQIDVAFSDAVSSTSLLENPVALFNLIEGLPIGFCDLEANGVSSYQSADSVSGLIENEVGSTSTIFRFATGAGVGGAIQKGFAAKSIQSNVITLDNGFLAVDNGQVELVTSDGSTYDVDMVFNLKTEVNTNGVSAPSADTRYYLYIDRSQLTDSFDVVGDADRKIIPVESGVSGAMIVLAETPDELGSLIGPRYVPITVLKTNSGSDYEFFDDLAPIRRQEHPGAAVTPLLFSLLDQSVGTVGAVANAQGPLEDSLFPTPANVRQFFLDNDDGATITEDQGRGDNLTKEGSLAFTGKGFFSRESIANFDGVDDVLTSSSSEYDYSSSMSAFVWIKADLNSTNRILINKGDDALNTRKITLLLDSSNNLFLNFNNTGFSGGNDIITIPLPSEFSGKWIHVGFTYGSSTRKIYINGQLVSEDSTHASLFSSSDELSIGASNSSGSPVNFYDGLMQDLFLTSETLTDDQVNKIYSRRYCNNNQLAGGHELVDDSFPCNDLTDKIVHFGLSDLNDGSPNALTLQNNGSVPFTGLNIFGIAECPDMTGAADSLSVDDTIFDLEDRTVAFMGGWFALPDWTPSALQLLASINRSAGGDDFNLRVETSGEILIEFRDGSNASISDPGFLDGSWHHIVGGMVGGFRKLYIDGVLVASVAETTAITTFATSVLQIGARGTLSSPANGMDGRVDEFFFSNQPLTDADIAKIAGSKIDLSGIATSIPVKQHLWSVSKRNENGHLRTELNDQNYLLDKRQDYLFASFFEDPGCKLDLKLLDCDLGVDTAAGKCFNTTYITDPTGTVSHGLPARPLQVWAFYDENADGEYVPLNVQNHIKVTDTDLIFDFTALTVVDATHPVQVVACSPAVIGVINNSENYVYLSSATTVEKNTKYIPDSSGGAFSLKLPPFPSRGDWVKFKDPTGDWATNNVTLDGNGQTINGTATRALTAANSAREVVYNGSEWRIYAS